jgi:hypothetical protein
MALDLELWFICSVLLIGIASNLGPKIVMIRKMVCVIGCQDYLMFDCRCRQMICCCS